MSDKPERSLRPHLPRNHETIGGGFFVFRRHRRSKRIHPSSFPFEHGSLDQAVKQAEKHAAENPGHVFEVLQVVRTIGTAAEPGEGI